MTAEALQLRTILERPDDPSVAPLFPRLAGDDYPADQARRGETRRRLEAWLDADSRPLRLTTRSPRILRDLDLLRRLDGRHAVSVGLALPSIDASAARRLEGPASHPEERLRALAELAAAGLDVTLIWTPVLPGLNDRPGSVDRLFAAAWQAGAHDVELRLPKLSILDRWRLPETVRQWFDPWGRLCATENHRLETLHAAQRLAHGFPRALPGRG